MMTTITRKSLIVGALLAGALLACDEDDKNNDAGSDGGSPVNADATTCEESIELQAWVQPGPVSTGVTVYGMTAPPSTTTVRAVLVAGVPATKTTFNYRGWSAQISFELLRSVATDQVASLPVIAVTSNGCQQLSESEQPRVRINEVDGGVDAEAGAADGSALDAEPADGSSDASDEDANDGGSDAGEAATQEASIEDASTANDGTLG